MGRVQILLHGTLRVNLDPLSQHTDAECLEALRRVELAGDGGLSLDTDIGTGGSNLSNGERQLIALARALLRQSSIIVLDESTASVGLAMDMKVRACRAWSRQC